jgi:alkylation response protein AidB-like acyl-CoA dehydrogenase
MDFAFSEEQELLRRSVRDLLAGNWPLDRVAELADGEAGWDPASLPRLAELGCLALSLPAERGGAGGDLVDQAVVFEEAGRALYPGPLFATVALAQPALTAAADPAPLEATAAGERSATLAVAEPDGPRTIAEAGASACVAKRDGDAWTLTGTKSLVPDAAIVTGAVVAAQASDGVAAGGEGNLALFLVDLAAHGDVVVPRSTMDATRRLGDLTLDATPATLLVAPDQAGQVLAATRQRALALLACEAVGVADRAIAFALEYAGQRQQFDRYIGSYQAVSHRLVDAWAAVELARSLAYWAAWCVANGDEQAARACAAAKSAAGEAAVGACEGAIQSMGGIGFTWDHPLHRLYKRAQWAEAFEDVAAAHRRDLASTLLDG